MKVIIQS